ncbi:MAG: Hpt domain-containing protein [Legionella sp.]
MLLLFIKENTEDLAKTSRAWEKHDLREMHKLVHKIKSGAIYCGATRMLYVCDTL